MGDDSRAEWDRRSRADSSASWERYEKLVLDKLDNHATSLDLIYKELVNIQIEMGVVKTKLAMIGALSGACSSVIVMVLSHFIIK